MERPPIKSLLSLICDGRNKLVTYDSHQTAIIDEGASIGSRTKIWHNAHICGGAVVGNDCTIGQNVFIGNNVRIGNNVKIQNNVSVFDNVFIEDNVFCGPSMVFTNVYNPRSYITRKEEYRDTIIREGATLGANCTVICGTEIGKYSFIGAATLVRKDVIPFAFIVGVPGYHKGWMSKFGEQLELPLTGNGVVECPYTKQIYTLVDGMVTCQEA